MLSPKPPFVWLVEKECRALIAAKAWWLLLMGMGPLVGFSFIGAVHTYAEVSGLNGTSAGVGEALAPLIGVWAPTFSACELVAVFLLPFVAIGLVAGDKQSGALKLELQQKMSTATLVMAKALTLLLGWAIAMLPPLSALLLWKSYGGALYTPELCVLIIGHVLNAGLTVSLATVAATLTESQSTAAIITLGVTVGTWILTIAGSIKGGLWADAAQYTPAAMVAQYQHGLIRLDVTLIALVLTGGGLLVGALWMRTGNSIRRRIVQSAALLSALAVAVLACDSVPVSWDLSESRGNSFPLADEQALKQIRTPLSIEVHLAAEDPRRQELETRALGKLRRILPHLQIRYVAATSIGLFEQTSAGYGEIRYELAGRRTVSRSTTAEGVLEAIYAAANVKAPAEEDEPAFRGHPLIATAKGAGLVFYGLWPAAVFLSAILSRRKLK